MHILENDTLKIKVKKIGAELCEIASVKNNNQFMWNANPSIWGSFAPNLFPIIGALKDNTFIYEGEKYMLPKHGFVRHNQDIHLSNQTENSISFKLISNGELLKSYPFQFEFNINYILIDNTLKVEHLIKNTGNKPMFFSVGGHPAFKCPVYENEAYTDYSLVFEQDEKSETHLLNMNSGLVSSQTKPVFETPNTIPLHYNLFDKDALIFKDLKSRKVTLNSKINGDILTVNYTGFPYLGIWAKPNADYVCIEPWLGIADKEDTNQDITTKEGIVKLEANNNFKATYTIQIHDKHLV